jgi:hypothetical protein
MTVDELCDTLGVTRAIADEMIAVQATVIVEDGLLLRVCAHGIRHPVAWLASCHRRVTDEQFERRHERRGATLHDVVRCCEARCCLAWVTHAALF